VQGAPPRAGRPAAAPTTPGRGMQTKLHNEANSPADALLNPRRDPSVGQLPK